MIIDDFLKIEEFRSLKKLLESEMNKYVPKGLIETAKRIYEWESDSEMLDWFYSPIKLHGEKRPYDLCKEGKVQELKNLILNKKELQ